MFFDRRELFKNLILYILGSLFLLYVLISYPPSIKIEYAAAIIGICVAPLALLTVCLKLFVWDKGLEVQGGNLNFVTVFYRYSIPLGKIKSYEIQYLAEKKVGIILNTDKKYTISPKALEGGFDACQSYLQGIGIPLKN